MSHSRLIWLFGLIVSLSLLLAACNVNVAPAAPSQEESAEAAFETESAEAEALEPAGEGEAPTGQDSVPVLRLAGGRDWGYPSPFGFTRGPGYIHASMVFDTLTWTDAEGEIIPWLAEAWAVAGDGLTWTFTLRDDVRWQDGEPLTAEDVAFSFNYQKANPTGFPLRSLGEVASAEASGEYEVTFTLDQPYAPFLTNVANAMQVLPKHIWEGIENPKSYRTPEAAIGSGPYKLGEYNQEDGSYLYLANEDFFMGEPAVKRVEFVPVGDEVLAVAQGEIHAGGPDVQAPVPEDVLARFEEAPLATLTGPGEWHLTLRFNMTKPPFDDVRFRQAVAYALDLEDMVDRVLLGHGQPGNPGWLSPANPWYNPEVPTYEHDPERARALLDEMELVDTEGDGIREMPDGTPLAWDLHYATAMSSRNAELIQSYLAEVGIQLTPVPADRNTNDQIAVAGDYDAILVGHGGLGGDPDFMRTIFHSKSKSQSFARPDGFANEQFDKLAGQQLRQTDPDKRRELVNQMQTILAEQLPVISLYHPTRYWFYDQTVLNGWHYTPGGLAGGIPLTLDRYLFVAGDAVVADE